MKTIIRGFLFSTLLTISIFLILSDPFMGIIERVAMRYALTPRPTILGLLTLIAIINNEIALALIPTSVRPPRLRRILHALTVAGISIIGFAVLATTDWSRQVVTSEFLDLSVSRPFIVTGGILFAGYLLDSLIIMNNLGPSRVHVHLPRAIRRYLPPQGEELLYCVQQSRLTNTIAPGSLAATNRRLIVHQPTNLGFTSVIEDYNYVDIANIKIERGWLFSTISIRERFEGYDMSFNHMPKARAAEFVRIVSGEMQHRQNIPLTTPLPTPPPEQTGVDSETLRILKRRLANGEISSDEYDTLCRKLRE